MYIAEKKLHNLLTLCIFVECLYLHIKHVSSKKANYCLNEILAVNQLLFASEKILRTSPCQICCDTCNHNGLDTIYPRTVVVINLFVFSKSPNDVAGNQSWFTVCVYMTFANQSLV